MVVWNFIKSLFIPKYMARHRFMPILVAIWLFVISTYLLLLPARYYYLHNTKKLVDNNNLYYLQAVRDIEKFAPSNDAIKDFENELIKKGIYTESGNVGATHLGLYEIEVDDNIIGYIEKKDTFYFNSLDTTVANSNEQQDYPTITSADGGFYINNVNDKKIVSELVSQGDNIDVIKVSIVPSNSHLEIDNTDTGINISSDKVKLEVIDNKLYANGIATTKEINNKVIIYFVSRTTTYYERDFSYVNDNGIKQNFKFVIDFTKEYVSKSPYTVDNFECDYLNQDYYFILVYKNAVFYQANLNGINDKNVIRDDKALQCLGYNISVSKLPFDLTNMVPTDFPLFLYDYVVDGYSSLAISNFSIISLIYLVGFTLVVSLLFSFLFRKTGRMKKFKEYYNIASIANIVPLVITFIVMWINPAWFGTVYLVVFAVYYLFVLYRINNSSEII